MIKKDENVNPNVVEQIDTGKVEEEEEEKECPPELEQVDIENERDKRKVEWLERVHQQE